MKEIKSKSQDESDKKSKPYDESEMEGRAQDKNEQKPQDYLQGFRTWSRQNKDKIALLLVSAALAARIASPSKPQDPQLASQPRTVIEQSVEVDGQPVSKQAPIVQAAEPEVLGFWGLHRRIWDALVSPVKSGFAYLLRRALAGLVALAIALFCLFVWPLPQFLKWTKKKFQDFVTNPNFNRLAILVKLGAGLGLLAAYWLKPDDRQVWLLVLGVSCLILAGLSAYWTYRRSAELSLVSKQNLPK